MFHIFLFLAFICHYFSIIHRSGAFYFRIYGINNPDRINVFNRAKTYANQQEDWGRVKKNIYVAMMSYLSGIGIYSGLNLLLDGAFPFFARVREYIFLTNIDKAESSYIHGGMPYDDAHRLIMSCPQFQSIDC